MNIPSKQQIQQQMNVLIKQFGDVQTIGMDEYVQWFRLSRRGATRHVHYHKVPHSKIGNRITFEVIDIATFLAANKHGGEPVAPVSMKNRRGFSQKK